MQINFQQLWTTSKFLQVRIIVFDEKNQTCSKYPKKKVYNIFEISSEKRISYLISSVKNKKLCVQKVTGDNFFKADTVLFGEIGVKKDSKYFTIKLFNKNIINKILHV